jgi:hypothetical protein
LRHVLTGFEFRREDAVNWTIAAYATLAVLAGWGGRERGRRNVGQTGLGAFVAGYSDRGPWLGWGAED